MNTNDGRHLMTKPRMILSLIVYKLTTLYIYQGRIQNFKLGGGAHLKKLRRAEGGAKILGVFRVKNHDYMPENHIFSNFRGGGGAPGAPPPLDPPLYTPVLTMTTDHPTQDQSNFVRTSKVFSFYLEVYKNKFKNLLN